MDKKNECEYVAKIINLRGIDERKNFIMAKTVVLNNNFWFLMINCYDKET